MHPTTCGPCLRTGAKISWGALQIFLCRQKCSHFFPHPDQACGERVFPLVTGGSTTGVHQWNHENSDSAKCHEESSTKHTVSIFNELNETAKATSRENSVFLLQFQFFTQVFFPVTRAHFKWVKSQLKARALTPMSQPQP